MKEWIIGDAPIDHDSWTPQEAANTIESFQMMCADCHARIYIRRLESEEKFLNVYLNPHECNPSEAE